MVLRKTRMSAFTGTELDLVLRALSTTALVVTGIQTPNCVRTTVFDAMALGYHVTVVADATAAKANDVHEANLADMAAIGVAACEYRRHRGSPGDVKKRGEDLIHPLPSDPLLSHVFITFSYIFQI